MGFSTPHTLNKSLDNMASLIASSSSLPLRTSSLFSLAPRFLQPWFSISTTLPIDHESHAESSSSPTSRLATLLPSFNGLIELFPHILLATPPKRRHTHSRKMMKFNHKGLKNRTNFKNCPACGQIQLMHNLCVFCFSDIKRSWSRAYLTAYDAAIGPGKTLSTSSHAPTDVPGQTAGSIESGPQIIPKDGEEPIQVSVMYWYLSFLRPPPVSVSLATGSITITPQVANDLRTEERLESTEIYYLWQVMDPILASPLPLVHLTTFNPPESSYKSLSIPLPTQAQNGQQWRLGLFNNTSGSPNGYHSTSLLGLTDNAPGIIGVWSEGILITSDLDTSGPIRGVGSTAPQKKRLSARVASESGKKDKGKGRSRENEGAKQNRIWRQWGLPDGSDLRIIEQTSFDLDKKIWDSGLALSSWIWRHTDSDANEICCSAPKTKVLEMLRSKRMYVVELGSGTGLVSIALGIKLRTAIDSRWEIVATDLDSAIPLMEENLQANGFPSLGQSTDGESNVRVTARTLDWEEPLPSYIREEANAEKSWPNLIIAADVTYNTASFPYLLKTLVALLNPSDIDLGDREPPLLLLAYKQRDPGERELWDLLKEKGIGMVKIDIVEGAEEEGPVEIWVGGMNVTSSD